MRFVVDKQRQLNYHPLVVYITMCPKEYQAHAGRVERMNDLGGLTRGLFKFRAIERGDKYSSDLTADLTATLSRFNVILRLVNDSEGNYNYALGKINLAQDPEIFEYELRDFVIGACKQNVKLLQGLLAANDADNTVVLSSMIQSFKDAISYDDIVSLAKSARRGSLLSDSNDMASFVDSDLCCQLPLDIVMARDSLYGMLSDGKAKSALNRIMAFLEERMDVAEMEESDQYAQGTVDNTKSEELKAELHSRHKQGERPEITIHVTRILPDLRKRVRKVWGVEITIGETTIPIHIGGADAAMVYICTLLKQKMGARLSREMFRRPYSKQLSPTSIHEDVLWLEKIYRVLCLGIMKDFDKWYEHLKDNSCHAISQGKAAANRVIRKQLRQYSEALYYCVLQPGKNEKGRGCYYIDIPAENIKLSKEIEAVINAE